MADEFVVVLRVRTSEGNPKKWDWADLLGAQVELLHVNRGGALGPYCPCCNRRLHAQRDRAARPCLVCGKPVEHTGFGRPRQLHPECRKTRAVQRLAAKEGKL